VALHGVRKRRRIDFALKRLRESWLLRGAAILAFMDYGGIIALALAGLLPKTLALIITFMSLATWVFLLAWYPVIEETLAATARMPGKAWIGRTLEGIATASAVLVHVLLAIMIVLRATARP
jgi:hypothetical protein